MGLEVEKKFIIHKDSELKLIQIGGVIKKEVSFSDAYFDTKNYDLALADTWLRKREGKWELKHPPIERCSSLTCQYIELNSDKEIASFLVHNFPALATTSDDAEMADISQTLFEFARFVTTRKTYKINDFQVDLDKTDFGYEVGEIELTNDENNDENLHTMVERVDSFAASIELSTSERVISKVEKFLQKYRPEHYETMVAANIFQGNKL